MQSPGNLKVSTQATCCCYRLPSIRVTGARPWFRVAANKCFQHAALCLLWWLTAQGKRSSQAIYGWKKKVTLEYYSLQIIHALFQATSLSIHQNFCSIQGWETSCYSFLFSCYCCGRIIYKKSCALLVHRQRTELQPNKCSQQSRGAAHSSPGEGDSTCRW